MLAGSFSIGINWLYGDQDQYYHDVDKKSEYYVTPKFPDLKSEIMEYEYLNDNMNTYTNEINKKATQYHQTDIVKSTIFETWRDKGPFEWIKKGEPISVNYLQCIILYTDYTQLSAKFSATFRPQHKYEPLSVTKKRNSAYYWLSRGLKELIAVFGQMSPRRGGGDGSKILGNCGLLEVLKNPFYTGMSIPMTMTEFQMRLYGPTSTSKQIAVAARFGGDKGILMEFEVGQHIRAFDVSWISRFGAQEDERYEITCM